MNIHAGHARDNTGRASRTLFVAIQAVIFLVAFVLTNISLSLETVLTCQILLMFVAAFCASVWVRFDFSHPLVWFPWPFFLYSIASPTLFLLDAWPDSNAFSTEGFEQAGLLQICALVCIVSAIGISRRPFNLAPDRKLRVLLSGAYPFIGIALIGCLSYLESWYNLGLTSKLDKYFAHDFVHTDFFFILLLVGMTTYTVAQRIINRALKLHVVLGYAVFLCISFLICGSREVLLRFLIVYLLLLTAFLRRVNVVFVALAGVGIAYLSTVMLPYGNMLLRRGQLQADTVNSFSPKDVVVTSLSSEFRTASENLIILADNIPARIPYFYGTLTSWEVLSSIRIGFVSGIAENNAATWFTETFYPDFANGGGGSGFTMVGQGYCDFGWLGVIGLYLVLGLAIRWIYNWSHTGTIPFLIYVNVIPTIIYSTRQSIAPILSQSVKHVLFPLLVIYVFGEFMTWKSSRSANFRQNHAEAGLQTAQ